MEGLVSNKFDIRTLDLFKQEFREEKMIALNNKCYPADKRKLSKKYGIKLSHEGKQKS